MRIMQWRVPPYDNGTYIVSLTATDKDGDTGSASKSITVTSVAPTPAIAGAPVSSAEGSPNSKGQAKGHASKAAFAAKA